MLWFLLSRVQEVAVFPVTDNYCFKRIPLTFCQKLNNLCLSPELSFSMYSGRVPCWSYWTEHANKQECLLSATVSLLSSSWTPYILGWCRSMPSSIKACPPRGCCAWGVEGNNQHQQTLCSALGSLRTACWALVYVNQKQLNGQKEI